MDASRHFRITLRSPGYDPYIVTAGLDPAVHAGDPRTNLFRV